jgi:predicted Zn-dependent protease
MLERAAEIDHAFNRTARAARLARGASPASFRDGGSPRIHRSLGMAYLQAGEPAKAVEALSYLVRIAPADDTAWQMRGIAEAELSEAEQGRGHAQPARAHLERAAVSLVAATLLRPENAEAWQALERVYRALGDPAETIANAGGPRSLDRTDGLAPRHLGEACAQLRSQSTQAGLAGDPERWPRCRDAGR